MGPRASRKAPILLLRKRARKSRPKELSGKIEHCCTDHTEEAMDLIEARGNNGRFLSIIDNVFDSYEAMNSP